MATNRNFDFVLFDMIGTTVQDFKINGQSFIIENFLNSFSKFGIEVDTNRINLERGKSKKTAITNILREISHPTESANDIYNHFIDGLHNSIGTLTEIDGTTKVFQFLKSKDIKIGIGSGLPLDLMLKITKSIGWRENIFSYINSSESLGKGRPNPIMINDAMSELKFQDPSKILKVGDTVADIKEGKNAGVVTAAVLTGTQEVGKLKACQPDYIFRDINGVITIC